jgi:hypothetical protein
MKVSDRTGLYFMIVYMNIYINHEKYMFLISRVSRKKEEEESLCILNNYVPYTIQLDWLYIIQLGNEKIDYRRHSKNREGGITYMMSITFSFQPLKSNQLKDIHENIYPVQFKK